jgi:hypothetical protein
MNMYLEADGVQNASKDRERLVKYFSKVSLSCTNLSSGTDILEVNLSRIIEVAT